MSYQCVVAQATQIARAAFGQAPVVTELQVTADAFNGHAVWPVTRVLHSDAPIISFNSNSSTAFVSEAGQLTSEVCSFSLAQAKAPSLREVESTAVFDVEAFHWNGSLLGFLALLRPGYSDSLALDGQFRGCGGLGEHSCSRKKLMVVVLPSVAPCPVPDCKATSARLAGAPA
ncbi:hypothetical protein GB937_004085 [Aspergillus fischeri]|nr:hypothetical protein GB937_004085 [Aspergillus fischeri]